MRALPSAGHRSRRAPAREEGVVEGAWVLPLVEHARYSSNVEVKRDAVAGLKALAASEGNKRVLGQMGALEALMELVFPAKAAASEEAGMPRTRTPAAPATPLSSTGASAEVTLRFRLSRTPAAPVVLSREASGLSPPLSPGRSADPLAGDAGRAASGAGGVQLPSLSKGLPLEYSPPRKLFTAGGGGGGPPVTKARFRKNEGDQQLLRLATTVLAELLTEASNQDRFVEADGLAKAYGTAASTTSAAIRRSLALMLFNLAKADKVKRLLFTSGGMGALFDLASHATEEKTRQLAVATVRRLAGCAENQQEWPQEALGRLLGWLQEHSEVRLQLLTLEALGLLTTVEAMRLSLLELGGIPVVASFLDMDRYDDDLRMLAAKCLTHVAESPETRPALGEPLVLLPFKVLLEHALMVSDPEQLRQALDAVVHFSDCAANHKRFLDHGYVPLLYAAASTPEKTCKKQAARAIAVLAEADPEQIPQMADTMVTFLPKIVAMMKARDYTIQLASTKVFTALSESEAHHKAVAHYSEQIMSLLDHWVNVPDDTFNRLATRLAANLAQYDEGRRRITMMLPVMKTFMSLTKSKDGSIQTESTRFLHNLTHTDDDKKSLLVSAGAVWRLNSVQKSNKASPQAKMLAHSALTTTLQDHVAAIRIQAMYRGRIQRKLAQQRMDKMRREQQGMA